MPRAPASQLRIELSNRVRERNLAAFVELGQGSRKSCAFEDTVSIGCLCVRQWGNGQWGNEKGCDEKSLE